VNEATKHFERVKFTTFWMIGTFVSFILYFSGFVMVYKIIRKHLFRRYRSIVVMYHRVRDDDKDPDMTVSSVTFQKQMAYLKKHFQAVSLDELMRGLEAKKVKDTVAITLDDGYEDNYSNAYPILRDFDLPATIFLISGESDLYEDMLTLEQIRQMQPHKILFGSHTISHPILTELDKEAAFREIAGSKKELETKLNSTVQFFAYPKGKRYHFNGAIKAFVKEAGYEAAFCTENGYVDKDSDRFEVRRIGIRNVPMFVFKTRLSGIFESRPVYSLRKLLGLT